jgi:hypothetical protein
MSWPEGAAVVLECDPLHARRLLVADEDVRAFNELRAVANDDAGGGFPRGLTNRHNTTRIRHIFSLTSRWHVLRLHDPRHLPSAPDVSAALPDVQGYSQGRTFSPEA